MSTKTLSKLLVTAMLLFPVLTYAQSNYKPGYVVNLKGDTIRGFIDYREWDTSPDVINFKTALTDKNSTTYSAQNIKSFSINKLESFVQYTGPISTDPDNIDQVYYKRDTSFRTGTVFMKLIEKGNRLALYTYKDELKERFFVADAPDFQPKELIFRLFYNPNYDPNYPVNADGSKNLRTIQENIYRRQLSALAVKYNELNDDLLPDIARSEYALDDILTIVSKINHYTKAEYKKNHYEGAVFNVFIGAALNINTTSTPAASAFYAAGGRGFTSFKPAVSFGANVFANPATRKLQFRLEISVAQAQFIDKYMSMVLPYEPTEASYNEIQFSISPQVIYNFYNADNFKVFAGVGITFSKFKYSNSYFGSQNHDNSEADIAANDPYEFNSTDNAFMGKAGIEVNKHFVIFASIQGNVANAEDGYFSLTSSSKQVGLNYIF